MIILRFRYRSRYKIKFEGIPLVHKNFSILMCLLICILYVNFGFTGSFGVGKYAGEFMSTGGGARALGMGGAFVSISDGAEAGYWNPAGLSDIQYPQIIGMHSRRFGGIVNYDYAAFAIPFQQDAGFALSLIRLAVDDIPETELTNPNLDLGNDNRPYVVRWLNNADYALYLSYAKEKNKALSYGANIKLIRRGVGDYSAWGIGFDFGLRLKLLDDLKVGANIQDATTTIIAWNTGRRELISPTLKTGFSYPLTLNFISSTAVIAADIDFRFEGRKYASQANISDISLDFHVGTEIKIKKVIALRVGTDIGNLSAGAGLHLPRLSADYAFLSHDELGKTHRVSLSISIEEEKFKRKQ